MNEQTVTWEYPNEFTRLARRGSSVTTWRHDAERGLLNEVEGGNGTIRYGYDAGGNRTTLATVRNNAQGVPTVETLTKYSYDELSRLEKVTAHDNTFTTYGYDQVGNRSFITRPNAVTTNYIYDELNRLTKQNNVYAQGGAQQKQLSSFEYSLALDGKRNKLEEEVLNPESVNSTATSVIKSNRTLSYDYDLSNRLTEEKREERQSLRAGGETSSIRVSGYEFDEVSNRKKLTTNSYNGIGANKALIATSAVDYSYNSADELTEETTTSGASVTSKTYLYDDNGAQTSITANSVVMPYRCDFEGKLVSAGDSDLYL